MPKSLRILFAALPLTALLLLPACASYAVASSEASAAATAASGPPAASDTPAGTAAPAPTPSPTPAATPIPTPTQTPTPTPSPAPPIEEIQLLFTGDIMYHGPTVERQWDKAKNAYDFTSYFERLAPIIRQADFAIGNFESPVWNVDESKLGELRFCAPPEAVPALASAGFDALTLANNHIMDQGLPALANTIQAIGDNGMLTAGAWRSERERDAVCMLERNGVKVALFAYTRFVNFAWRNDQGMGVNTIDTARMAEDVKRAHVAGADFVIFFLHFGTEYTHDPDGYQKSIVKALKEAGADAVIGAHPHVLQPIAVDPDTGFLAAYSLGNVITYRDSWDRQYSALLKLTVRKYAVTGKTVISSISYVPTWAKTIGLPGEQPKMRAFDLRQALKDCEAGTDPMLPKKYLNELKNGMKIAQDVLGAEYMEPLD